MASWQWVLIGLVLLVPVLLYLGQHRRRERLSVRGVPLRRDWPAAASRAADEGDHH